MEERARLRSKTRINGSKNAYISQNKSKKAREGEINGLQGSKNGSIQSEMPLKRPKSAYKQEYLRQSETCSKQFWCGKSVF